MAYDQVQLDGAFTSNATTCILEDVWLDVPESWPQEEVLIGFTVLRKLGLGDLFCLMVQLHKNRVINVGSEVAKDVKDTARWVTRKDAFTRVGLRSVARTAADKLVSRVGLDTPDRRGRPGQFFGWL